MSNPILEIRHLSKSFDDFQVLKDINLKVYQKELCDFNQLFSKWNYENFYYEKMNHKKLVDTIF